MKNTDLWNAIDGVDEELLADARPKKRALSRRLRKLMIPAVAVLLIGAILFGVVMSRTWEQWPTAPREERSYSLPDFNPDYRYPIELLQPMILAHASYPTMLKHPSVDKNVDYSDWDREQRDRRDAYRQAGVDIDAFIERMMKELLATDSKGTALCSPVNLYIAFAMLAEVTDGESRAQIMEVLGVPDMDTLRSNVSAIWKACYGDDGNVTSVLANSLWLNKDGSFHQETLSRLAELYYASSFHGDMGSSEFEEAFHAWMNYHTGGLLTDQVENLQMDPSTAMILASTILFRTSWANQFSEQNSKEKIFHGLTTDTSCVFMNGSETGSYYRGKQFTAASKAFSDGGKMTFLLPNKGVTPEELLGQKDVMTFLLGDANDRKKVTSHKSVLIDFSMPRFDVTDQTDLIPIMRKLGMTDVLSFETANFSPLTDDFPVKVDYAEHTVRVRVNEEGVVAAAYTVMGLNAGGMLPPQPVDFVLDRPFIFVIYSDVGLPLFVGVINDL